MPSHRAAHGFGAALDSRGFPITAIMWRANRLVDALAKTAAAERRVPAQFYRCLADVQNYARYWIARLGVVTLAANRHTVTYWSKGGSTHTLVLRDSQALRQCRGKRK